MSTHGAALNRWRLVLGKSAEAPLPLGSGQLERMDDALDFLYVREAGPDVRRDPEGGQGESQPSVARWLSEVRDLFPQETAEILQRHALDRYHLTALLTDQEVLEQLEPDEALLEMVLSLKGMMKGPVLDAARRIVARVVQELTEKCSMRSGALPWGSWTAPAAAQSAPFGIWMSGGPYGKICPTMTGRISVWSWNSSISAAGCSGITPGL